MSNFRMLPRNIVDEATMGAPSPALLSTLPATNLQTQPRAEVARTDGLASQVISCTWPTNQKATMVALCRHNLTTGGTIRAQLYSDEALSSQLVDSSSVAAFSTSGFAQVDADDYLEDDFRAMKNWVFHFAEQTTVRGLKITLTDASNPDGYMEASRLFVGSYFEATYNVPMGGYGLMQETLTSQGRDDGGGLISDRGGDFRTLRLDLSMIAEDDVPEFCAIARRLGKHRDFWFDLYPEVAGAEAGYLRGQFKFTDLGPLEKPEYAQFRRALVLGEV